VKKNSSKFFKTRIATKYCCVGWPSYEYVCQFPEALCVYMTVGSRSIVCVYDNRVKKSACIFNVIVGVVRICMPIVGSIVCVYDTRVKKSTCNWTHTHT